MSAQVLSEFAVNALRKPSPALTIKQVTERVQEISLQTIIPVDQFLVGLALERMTKSRISDWDALIVEAAIRSGATALYTEDMHHGTRYGELQLVNPFVS